MATYAEVASIREQEAWNAFLNKVRVAATIKAAAIIDSDTPAAAALEWARQTISNPSSAGDGLVWYVVASNVGVSVAAMLGASDSAIQTNINAAVDAIYGG